LEHNTNEKKKKKNHNEISVKNSPREVKVKSADTTSGTVSLTTNGVNAVIPNCCEAKNV